MDQAFLRNVGKNLAALADEAKIAALYHKSIIEYISLVTDMVSHLELTLGEAIGQSKIQNIQQLEKLPYRAWLGCLYQGLRDITQIASGLQVIFDTLTVVMNEGIKGWNIVAATKLSCSTTGLNVSIPAGAHGVLTGEIVIYTGGIDVFVGRKLALDTEKLRQLLQDCSEFAITHDHASSYWDSTSQLKGDHFIASRLAFYVHWLDDIDLPESVSRRPIYMPWLAYGECKEMYQQVVIPDGADRGSSVRESCLQDPEIFDNHKIEC